MVEMATNFLNQFGDVLLWIAFLIVFVAAFGVRYTAPRKRHGKDTAPHDGQ